MDNTGVFYTFNSGSNPDRGSKNKMVEFPGGGDIVL